MNFIIRQARHEDALGIISVHVNSIRNVCAKDYTSEQIEAWSGRRFKADLWKQAMDRDFIWVVEYEGKVTGFGHFAVMDEESGEVMGLYFVPPAIGKGLGKKMMEEIFQVASKFNLKKISLHSTLTAKSFYETMGFRQYESDTTVEMQGVDIPCHPMMIEI